MGDSVTNDSFREEIWTHLSEIFCRESRDYAYIASKISNYSVDDLETIYFEEVAPVCYEFLQPYPVDPEISTFDREWLVQAIKKRLDERKASSMRRTLGNLYLKIVRKACAKDWNEFRMAFQTLKNERQSKR